MSLRYDDKEDMIAKAEDVLNWLVNLTRPTAPASLDLDNTPERWVKMMRELTTPKTFAFTTFESDTDEMIIVSPIPFYSLCSHHLIPFMGQAHVAYVPQGKIAGLSKIARTVQYHMRGLWTQEDLTRAIADTLIDKLNPLGVAVVMRGEHLCMTMRGAQSPGTLTTTSRMTGCFADHSKLARAEFLRLISSEGRHA